MGQYLILWVKDKHSAGLAGPERLLCEEKGKGTLEARGAALGHWTLEKMVTWEQRC